MHSLQYAEISFLSHATEDHNKSLAIISDTLHIPPESFAVANLQGHFRNPVNLLRAKVVGADANRLLELVLTSLRESDKKIVATNLPSHIDERGILYIRISKQLLYKGEFSLSQANPIKIIFKPNHSSRSSNHDTFRLLLK